MRHLDLFSGIGGFALACSWVWGDEYENVGHSEIEPYADAVYHKHFPRSTCLGDIKKIEWREGQADLITAGFPCQPHSVQGKRRGSFDERDLWGECVRALRGVRPQDALFENTPGLLTSERGRFFNAILSDLARLGYDVQWGIVSACAVGAPHTRDRVWIVAHDSRRGKTANVSLKIRRFPCFSWVENVRGVEDFGRLSGVAQPIIRRGRNGIRQRLHALGNAIVPQVAQVILEAIKESGLK